VGTFLNQNQCHFHARIILAIDNLHTVQTVSSIKAATALDKSWPTDHRSRLNVLLQVNTSGEDAKSGLSPELSSTGDGELFDLARHILRSCPRLHLQGLMTIGALSESLSDLDENRDFDMLKRARDALQNALSNEHLEGWGEDGKLLLSMGMSSDFEMALRMGSDIVRVGTGIFGERHKKGE
jgi:PLP dependent protein